MLTRFKGGLQKTALFTKLTTQNQLSLQQQILFRLFSTDPSQPHGSDSGQREGNAPLFTNRQRRPQINNERKRSGSQSYQERGPSRSRNPYPQQSNQQEDRPQSHQKQRSHDGLMDHLFIQKFGKTKSDLLDSWLEMESADLAKECERMGVKASSKHIENIQNLFEHLKQVEIDLFHEGKESGAIDKLMKEAASQGSSQHQRQDMQRDHHQSQYSKATSQSQHDNLFKKNVKTPIEKQTHGATSQSGGANQSQPRSHGHSDSKHQFAADQEKARENLNEQLARILSKRKGIQTKEPQTQETSTQGNQKNLGKPQVFSEQSSKSNQGVAEIQSVVQPQNQMIQNPFTFSISTLKQAIHERGPIIKETSQSAHGNFHLNQGDAAQIDRFFEMSSEQLDAYFSNIVTQKNSSTIFQQMSLKPQDFEKLPSITKKKVLINMTSVRSTIPTDPNSLLQEQRLTNLKNLVSFSKENQCFLSKQSREIVSEQLLNVLRQGTRELRAAINGSPSMQNDLIKVAQDILKTNKDGIELLRGQLQRIYLEEQERIYQDVTLDQVPQYARAIKFITANDANGQKSNQIKEVFGASIKKAFKHKNIKQLSFDDQLAILEVLPNPNVGQAEEQTSQQLSKSLNYQILNELMSNNPNLKDNWFALTKEQIFAIVEKSMELNKCRDLSNKLRGCLLYISTQTMALQDYFKLFKLLAEGNNFQDGRGTVDVKLVSNLLLRRNIKTAANLLNTSNVDEIRQHFEFYDFIYKKNPVTFAFATNELKLLLSRAIQLAQEQYLPMQEMMRFSKTVIPSLFKPNLFFTEMITNTRESFRADVDKNDLYDFVGEILKRVKEGEYGFEHLQQSNSRMHRNYRPFTEKTILLLQRIMQDLTSGQISQPDLRVLLQILSNQQMSEFLFKSHCEAEEVISKIVDSQVEHLNRRLAELTNSTSSANVNIDFNAWIETFDAMQSMALLTGQSGNDQGNSQVGQKIVNQLVPATFALLKQEIFKTNDLVQTNYAETPNAISPLDSLFKLNKAILGFFDKMAGPIEPFYNESQVRELVTAVLESHFINKKPFILSFEKFKKNIKISKMIQLDTTKDLIQSNGNQIVHFMNYSFSQIESGKEIAKAIAQAIQPISRSIVGQDLVNLFKMIDKYGITDDCRQLLVNVAPNLMTIESQKVHIWESPSGEGNKKFENINSALEKADQDNKMLVLKKYQHLFHQQPELLKRPEASLSPLSYLMAEVLDQYNDEQVLLCLEILGSEKVENYHEEFIKKLYERYSPAHVIDNMATNNQKFFLKFAKHWPHFLKNNAMLNQLIQLGKQSSTLVKQQSETLHILARKNVLHPELLVSHLDTFMKMKDRERVMEYLQEYLHSAAFLGFTQINNADMQRITQLFRRLYKTPEQVPEIKQLLDYMIVLALSNAYYKDFDEKSVEFVEQALNLIEHKFTGQEILEVALPNPVTGEIDPDQKVKLAYFRSIPSNSKVYNKVLLRSTLHNSAAKKLNFVKTLQEIEAIRKKEASEMIDEEESLRLVQEVDGDEDGEGSNIIRLVVSGDGTVSKVSKVNKLSKESEELLDQLDEILDEKVKTISKKKREQYEYQKDLEEIDEYVLREGARQVAEDRRREKLLKDSELDQQPDFVLNEDIDAEMHAAVSLQHLKDAEGKKGKQPKEKKIYERKASESLYSEELEFHQFRKKKLQDLDKKSKHLLLFSNINQLNFVDVNQNDLVKAWSVLFHFKSKSFDSIIYDEFESIVMRNTIGKSKGHELFSKFYLKLIEASYDQGFRMHLTTKCEKTGWPIDISIHTTQPHEYQEGMRFNTNSIATDMKKKLALYFFLQEEVCLNANEQSEEPLGLQKLMLKHLQTISDYKVEYVTENDFYMNKDSISGYVDYLLQEKLLRQPLQYSMSGRFRDDDSNDAAIIRRERQASE